MLLDNFVIEKNSIEEIFCKPFHELERHEMSEDTAELLITLLLISKRGNKLNIPEEEKPFMFKLIEKRVNYVFNYELDQETIIFLTQLCETPGIAVMYMTYLQYWSKTNSLKEISIDDICTKIFPFGIPAKKDLEILWDNQKVNSNINGGTDNLLDYPIALQSIL